MPIASEIRMYARFLGGLPAFLRRPITLEEARAQVARRLAERETRFLRLIERGVFGHPQSPYLPLMEVAGCELGDVRQLVRARGLEGTLQTLREAGVYISFEEFKGLEPIVRGGRVVDVTVESFDNPFLSRAYRSETGGTTGVGTRVGTDLEHLADQASHLMLTRAAHGVLDVPTALWRGVLPDGSGINNILRSAHYGRYPAKWFSPVVSSDLRPSLKYRLATQTTVAMARLFGAPIPWPEHVGLDEAIVVARWAAETLKTHRACLVLAPVSRALRVSLAAREAGLDLSGATFMIAGEPLTPAKTRGIERSGARYFPTYGLAEAGRLAGGCANPIDENDLHLFTDGFAVIQKPRKVPGSDIEVSAFNITSLMATTPKIMLNVEIDDYGIIERRSCGCPLEALGFTEHVRGIHSFRKLTGEGVTLVGSEMVHVLEEVLPSRFGGSPLDYQLLEEEDENGFTRLNLLIAPTVPIADTNEAVAVVWEALGRISAGADSARAIWSQAQILRIKRMAPIWTARGKLMPLHLSRETTRAGS